MKRNSKKTENNSPLARTSHGKRDTYIDLSLKRETSRKLERRKKLGEIVREMIEIVGVWKAGTCGESKEIKKCCFYVICRSCIIR